MRNHLPKILTSEVLYDFKWEKVSLTSEQFKCGNILEEDIRKCFQSVKYVDDKSK